MAQKIDTSEFVDQFTDGTVRYAQSGIDRISKNTWIFTLSNNGTVYTVRSYKDGVSANVNAAAPTALVLANTKLNVYQGATLSGSVASTSWTNTGTGVYTVDISAFASAVGSYTVELEAQTTFTNPSVSAKTSIITDGSATYPTQTLTTTWVAESDSYIVSPAAVSSTPVLDGVDFALQGNISFR